MVKYVGAILVKRHLNIASQYIDYVAKGVFPYKTTR